MTNIGAIHQPSLNIRSTLGRKAEAWIPTAGVSEIHIPDRKLAHTNTVSTKETPHQCNTASTSRTEARSKHRASTTKSFTTVIPMSSEVLSHTPEWYDGSVRAEDAPDDFQEAFENMREAGLATVEGEGCCSNCTGGAVHSHAEEHDAIGCVFYHEQDVDRGYGEMWLGFDTARDDIPQEAIAGMVIQALNDAGIGYEWEGTASKKVKAVRFQEGEA